MTDGNYWNDKHWPKVMKRRLSRRRLIQLSALGTAGAVSAAYLGCGGDDERETGPSKTTSTPVQGTPRPGGTLTIATQSAFSSMDPAYHSTGLDRIGIYNLYDAPILSDMDGRGNLVLLPSLAENWEWVDDNHLNMTFRKGVTFHDETGFDAAAVKYHFDRLLDPDTKSPRRSDYKMLDHVEQNGDSVTYVLGFPSALFLGGLTAWGAAIPSPSAVQKYGNDFRNNPVGCGAFIFKREESSVYYEFVKNPDYWREGEPLLDGFNVRVIPDKAVCAAALIAGEVDMASQNELDAMDIASFAQNPEFNVVVGGSGSLAQIFINKSRAPGNNLHLRKAISLAINREEFISKYNGYAFLTPGPLPRRTAWDNPDEPDPEFNLEKAKNEMKLAGLEDGISIEFTATNDPTSQSDTELLQAQLSRIGVKLNVDFIALTAAGVKLAQGDYDFAFGNLPAAVGNIDYEMETFFQTGGFFNGGTTQDPEIDRLVDTAKNTQEDFSDRRETYWKIMRMISDNVYQIYLVGIPEIAVMREKLQGYVPPNEPGGIGYDSQFRPYWIA